MEKHENNMTVLLQDCSKRYAYKRLQTDNFHELFLTNAPTDGGSQ